MMVIKKSLLLIVIICTLLTGCDINRSHENINSSKSVENTVDINEVFVENIDYIEKYNESDFNINSDTAISNTIDALIKINMYPQDTKFMCTEMTKLNNEAYYQVIMYSENEQSTSNIGVFWVNAKNGEVYLKFDPTIDIYGYFASIAGNIDENDGRTRLILITQKYY